MVFQGFPTQAEALSEGCTDPLGPTFGSQKRVRFGSLVLSALEW